MGISCNPLREPSMKERIMKLWHLVTGAAVGAFIFSQAGVADQYPLSTDGSDPQTWDPGMDGPIGAPENHKVIFENENIRIMSVRVLPGAREPYHSHAKCSVLVFDSPAKVTDYNKAGVATARVLMGAISWLGEDVPKNIPFVGVQPPQALHSIANNDTH